MPGGDAVGSKAVVGASFAAMPRLQPLPAPGPPVPEVTPEPLEAPPLDPIEEPLDG
jgi:hypothetical protein